MTSRLILGALPLPLYPAVAVASLMSLAGQREGGEGSLPVLAVSRGFLVGSLAYPLVFLACVAVALVLRKSRPAVATRITEIPLYFLILLGVLFAAWSGIS